MFYSTLLDKLFSYTVQVQPCTCTCTYVIASICTKPPKVPSKGSFLHVQVCDYTHTSTHVCIHCSCMYMYMYIHVYTCTCIPAFCASNTEDYIYMYMHVCTCMYNCPSESQPHVYSTINTYTIHVHVHILAQDVLVITLVLH